MIKLTEHFALHEFFVTKKKLNNFPQTLIEFEEVYLNLVNLTVNVLEPIREHFGVVIDIFSAYRTWTLNNLVGGVNGSDHLSGNAADFTLRTDVSIPEICKWIKNNLEFDQCIEEWGKTAYPQWVHVSYRKGCNRKQSLVIR
jgi:hypothetical protein